MACEQLWESMRLPPTRAWRIQRPPLPIPALGRPNEGRRSTTNLISEIFSRAPACTVTPSNLPVLINPLAIVLEAQDTQITLGLSSDSLFWQLGRRRVLWRPKRAVNEASSHNTPPPDTWRTTYPECVHTCVDLQMHAANEWPKNVLEWNFHRPPPYWSIPDRVDAWGS